MGSSPRAAAEEWDWLLGALQRFGLERDRMRTCLAAKGGLGPSELDALEHLEAAGPLTQRDLGERLLLTSGGVTLLVDRLEEGGWVTRRPHPEDRRYVLVELAPGVGRRLPLGLVQYHDEIRELAAGVPARHREAIGEFLTAAADAASAATDRMLRHETSRRPLRAPGSTSPGPRARPRARRPAAPGPPSGRSDRRGRDHR